MLDGWTVRIPPVASSFEQCLCFRYKKVELILPSTLFCGEYSHLEFYHMGEQLSETWMSDVSELSLHMI